MRGVIIVNKFLRSAKFDEIYDMLVGAFLEYDVILDVMTNADVMINIGAGDDIEADFVLYWDKDMALARLLEGRGHRLYNSAAAIEVCDDKGLTAVALEGNGIAMPRTIVSPFTYANVGYTDYEFLSRVIDTLGLPMVVKESKGSFGRQVYLINTAEELLAKTVEIGGKNMLFQELVATSYGRDVRLQVVGGEVVAAVERTASDGAFKANVTSGGIMTVYNPPESYALMAKDACRILGVDFGGVDILHGERGEPLLCEVNTNAHFMNLYKCCGVNVADKIARYVIEDTARRLLKS